jgi:hypothetical protein
MLELEGIKPSSQILDELAEEGKPVILNFSRGKDSVALWAELHKRQMQVIPVHYSMVPDLQFVKSDLQRYEQHYQTHIYDLPADTFYDMLQHNLNQPPVAQSMPQLTQLSIQPAYAAVVAPTRRTIQGLSLRPINTPTLAIAHNPRRLPSTSQIGLSMQGSKQLTRQTDKNQYLWLICLGGLELCR